MPNTEVAYFKMISILTSYGQRAFRYHSVGINKAIDRIRACNPSARTSRKTLARRASKLLVLMDAATGAFNARRFNR